jgi:hypothetical protein
MNFSERPEILSGLFQKLQLTNKLFTHSSAHFHTVTAQFDNVSFNLCDLVHIDNM